MTTTHFIRSPDPAYSIRLGGSPELRNDPVRDRVLIYVHESEMSADLPAALLAEIDRTSEGRFFYRTDGPAEEPTFIAVPVLKPADQIPDGKPVHIEYDHSTTPTPTPSPGTKKRSTHPSPYG